MTCEQTETLLAQLASGDTPGNVEEAALMDDATAHVATCDRCREKLADYRITLKLLTDAFASEDAASGLAALTLSAERKDNLLKRLSSPITAELARTSGGAPVPDPLSADEGRFNIRNYLRPLGVAASFGLVALGAWGLVDALAPRSSFPLSAKSESPVASVLDTTDSATLIADDEIASFSGTLVTSEAVRPAQTELRTRDDFEQAYKREQALRVAAEQNAANREADPGRYVAAAKEQVEELANRNSRLRSELADKDAQIQQLNADKVRMQSGNANFGAQMKRLGDVESEHTKLNESLQKQLAADGWREGRDDSGKLGDTLDRDGDAIADHRRWDRPQQNGQALAPAEPAAPQATGAFAGLPGGERGGQAGGAGGAAPAPGAGGGAAGGRAATFDGVIADGTMKNDRNSEFFFAPAPESAAAGITPAPGNAPQPADPAARSKLGLGYVGGEKESGTPGVPSTAGTPGTPSPDAQRFAGLADARGRSMRGADPGKDGQHRGEAEGGELADKGGALAPQTESLDDRTVAFADEAKREADRPMTRSGLERQSIAAGDDVAGLPYAKDRPTRQPAKPAAPAAPPPLVTADLSSTDAPPATTPTPSPKPTAGPAAAATPVTPVTPAAPDDLALAQSNEKPMVKKQLQVLRNATEEQPPAGEERSPLTFSQESDVLGGESNRRNDTTIAEPGKVMSVKGTSFTRPGESISGKHADTTPADGAIMDEARRREAQRLTAQADEHAKNGLYDRAREDYEKALTLDPSNEQTHTGKDKVEGLAGRSSGEKQLKDYDGKYGIMHGQAQARYAKAMEHAEKAAAAGNYTEAQDALALAKAVVDQNRQSLSESEYAQMRERTLDRTKAIDSVAEAQRIAEISEKEVEAKQEQSTRKQMASAEREKKIEQLLRRAADLRKDLNYEQSQEVLDQLLFLDPNNVAGVAMKEMVEDAIVFRNHRELNSVRSLKIAEQSNENLAATIPHTELITYPPNWPQLSAMRLKDLQLVDTTKADAMQREMAELAKESDARRDRLRQLEADLPLVAKDSKAWDDTKAKLEAETAAYYQWKAERSHDIAFRYRDLSKEREVNGRVEAALRQPIPVNFEGNKLENVIEYLRNVTGTNIVVNWRALEQVGVKPDTTVTLQLTSVPADKAIELVLDQVAGDAAALGMILDRGVVTVSTAKQVEAFRQRAAQTAAEQTAKPQAAAPAVDDGEADALPAASNFKAVPVNPFVMTERDRQSTFGLDTDTASYALVRKYVRAGFLPPAGAVRMEEFVNAFDYNYPTQSEKTFTVHAEAGAAPYGEGLALVKIGVKAKTVGRDARKPAHLVFVIDASGSMDRPDRLPLVKHSLGMLVRQLGPEDRVSIVAYGTHSIVVEEAEPASNHEALLAAIGSIQAGGSTNMIDAMGKGYDVARNHFEPGQINRVILCSDGVANVGATDAQQMLDKVAANRRQGITLTNVGFGIGGYNDALMTDLAKKGDGNYVFVDTAAEAKRLFVDNLASTLQTVAKDAKIQVEFDPARVRRYRLIGYERRDIADKDFRNDAVDAGEVGSGQSATALYEVELLPRAGAAAGQFNLDLGTVSVRYRNADTNEIEEISYRLSSDLLRERTVKSDPRFYLAASAAEYAELLRGSEHASGGSLERIEQTMAQVVEQLPLDRSAAELLDLVRQSKGLPAAP